MCNINAFFNHGGQHTCGICKYAAVMQPPGISVGNHSGKTVRDNANCYIGEHAHMTLFPLAHPTQVVPQPGTAY